MTLMRALSGGVLLYMYVMYVYIVVYKQLTRVRAVPGGVVLCMYVYVCVYVRVYSCI